MIKGTDSISEHLTRGDVARMIERYRKRIDLSPKAPSVIEQFLAMAYEEGIEEGKTQQSEAKPY